MNRFVNDRKRWIAFAAMIALVVQTFLTAWTGAAMAGQPSFDAFGNPLCITDTVDRGATPGSDHGKTPACCALGCAAFVSALAGPQGELLELFVPFSADLPLPEAIDVIDPRAIMRGPGSPRAPPLHL